MRVLIVDDDVSCRRLLEVCFDLHEHEHDVRMATDGVDIVRRAYDCQPDIILMDIAMPEVDGFEALAALKADESTASIPVVIISAMCTREDDFERGLRLGAAGYITKPFNVFGLVDTLEGYVAKKKVRDGPGLRNPNLNRERSF